MIDYVLAGDVYQAISGVVKGVSYLDSLYTPTDKKINAVFNQIDFESNSLVKKLVVPLNITFEEGDQLRVFFENHTFNLETGDKITTSSRLKRKLWGIELPDIIRLMDGNKVVKAYRPFLDNKLELISL